jgi:hypothetical protein
MGSDTGSQRRHYRMRANARRRAMGGASVEEERAKLHKTNAMASGENVAKEAKAARREKMSPAEARKAAKAHHDNAANTIKQNLYDNMDTRFGVMNIERFAGTRFAVQSLNRAKMQIAGDPAAAAKSYQIAATQLRTAALRANGRRDRESFKSAIKATEKAAGAALRAAGRLRPRSRKKAS